MKKYSFIFLLIALLWSCESDFEINAPHKEVMVIDGLLDPLERIQTIKVSKAFLGEGNALVMAQQKDSSNYGDILDVKLEGIRNNQVLQTFNLQRVEMNDKEPGTFSNTYVVYNTTPGDSIYQDGRLYKVTVTNRVTGVSATSMTEIVRDLHVNTPVTPILNPDSIMINFGGLAPYRPGFTIGQNSSIYDLIIRFHYRELDQNGVSTEESVDWNFEDKFSADNDEVTFLFFKDDFFRNLGESIEMRPGFTRRTDSLSTVRAPFEFIFIQGSENLKTYIQLMEPASGIVQERPLFTTVENGLGLFTSRIRHSTFGFPGADTKIAFDTSRFTRDLGFDF